MNGMEKIQARIAEDAKAELSNMEAETKKQIDEIKAKATAEANRLADEILTRGKKEAEDRKARLASSADMEGRKMELAMKQKAISGAFDKALSDLCNRPQGEYIDLLVSLALASVSSGTEQLVFSAKDKEAVGKQVVAKVNDAIGQGKAPELPSAITDSKAGPFLEKVVKAVNSLVKASGTSGGVTVAEETRPMAGGFIMVDKDVEINCDFDTLVRLERGNIELEVANRLFG